MWVQDLADASAEHGGKAANLARLIRAGLPVPEGFVVSLAAFRALAGELAPAELDALGHTLAAAAERLRTGELPPELEAEVVARASALGPVVAVRSSATIEDRDHGAAAGVFSSFPTTPASEVWTMIRAVWASALTPLAAAYAHHRAARIAMGVIVQRSVPGEHVTIYTRPPGEPSSSDMLVQRGALLTRIPRDAAHLAIRAEVAIGATGGADVELVGDRIVQARAIVHPAPRAHRTPAPPSVIAALVADGRRWTWDVTHNPDPLSPAQAGLVERVDRAQLAPWSLRVCAGFLYSAPRGPQPSVPRPSSIAELDARVAEIERSLARALGAEVPPLAEAIERYLAAYRIWANELVPLIAAARAPLRPSEIVGARPSAIEHTLLAAARGELSFAQVAARIGMFAPAWDVAVATYGEQPGVLQRAIARARTVVLAVEARSAGPDADAGDEIARAGADLAERDDVWFARAQLLVRKALLARADELGIDRDDVCWMSLDDVLAATALDRDEAKRRAAAARTAAARAAHWAVPVVVGGEAATTERVALRGIGTGPRVTGRVVRFASLASAVAVGPADIVVTRAVTPALAVMVIGCAALVSETGGLLDHGAALARELGIPCVVGCHDAWSLLADGMVVSVDGERGSVELAATTHSSSSS